MEGPWRNMKEHEGTWRNHGGRLRKCRNMEDMEEPEGNMKATWMIDGGNGGNEGNMKEMEEHGGLGEHGWNWRTLEGT